MGSKEWDAGLAWKLSFVPNSLLLLNAQSLFFGALSTMKGACQTCVPPGCRPWQQPLTALEAAVARGKVVEAAGGAILRGRCGEAVVCSCRRSMRGLLCAMPRTS